MQGFGFIPDSTSAQNPDALPVGFVRDDGFINPYTEQKNVVLGITCAACHTGELFFGGKAIRIDAGPSLIDLQKFTEALGLAVTWTYYDPVRFHRFAKRCLAPITPMRIGLYCVGHSNTISTPASRSSRRTVISSPPRGLRPNRCAG